MNTRRSTYVPAPESPRRRNGYFSRTQAWIAAVVTPLTIVGIAMIGFALPANATSEAGSADSTSSTTSGDSSTNTTTSTDEEATSTATGDGSQGTAESGGSQPATPTAATLILKSSVSGTATQADWTPQTASGSDKPVSQAWDTPITLDPGTYTLSEVASSTPPPAGYSLTGLTCDPAGDPATSMTSPTVTLAAGADVTCTFTNTAAVTPERSSDTLMPQLDLQADAVPSTCATIGGFEIDGNMTPGDCGGVDWSNVGNVSIASQGGTYQTSNKDSSNPSTWTSAGSTPDKGNFERSYAKARIVNGHYYVYAAWDRTGTSGTGGYVVEIDNAGVRTGSDGSPQPDRSQGGVVLSLETQGSDAPTLARYCSFGPTTYPNGGTNRYPGTCHTATPDGSEFLSAVNSFGSITDPLNGGATVPTNGFLEVGLDVTLLTGVAPGCPASNVASLYLRSVTGNISNGNLKAYMQGVPVTPPTDCPTITIDKGGVRDSDGDVDPLAGATFTAYAGSRSDDPSGPPVGTCTTAADGSCTITVTTDSDRGYWVVETSAPDGWSAVGSLGTGNYNDAKNVTSYRYHIDSDGGTLPTDADAPRQGRDVMDHSDQWANVADNPPFPQKCGLNIAMVFDTSASISHDEMDQFKDAANTFVGDGGLGGTPSTVSMYEFSTHASKFATSISLSTSSGVTQAQNRIDSLPYSGNGYTNWDAAFRAVAADGGYDLVLFMTDGDPTTYGNGNSAHLDVPFLTIEQGIFSANEVKAQTGLGGEHTKIVGVGVGMSTNSYLNLAAVTGPTQGDDYFLASDFGDLKQKLQDIATKNCGGTLTVVKKTETSDGTVIDESAAGWTFTATGDVVPGGSATQTTGDSGTNFALSFPDFETHTVTVEETPQSGYELHQQDGLNASCNVDGVADSGDLGFTVPIGPSDIVKCTVVNRQVATSAAVDKTWTVKDSQGNTIATYNLPGDESSLPAGLDAEPTVGGTPTTWGTPVTGLTPGAHVAIGETASVDPAKLPGCTLDTELLTKANGTVVDPGAPLPYDALLGSGANTYTITNTVTCEQTLTLVKDVSYGSASPTAWTLSAEPPNGSSALPGFSGQTGISGTVSAGVGYDLDEADGPATYIPTDDGWQCTTDQDDPLNPVDGAVTVPLGQNVTCTITNTTAKLTLFKHTGSDTLQPGWFDLTGTPASGQSGLSATTVPGVDGTPDGNDTASTFEVRPDYTYTLTEALSSGHDGVPYLATALQKWDSSAGGGQGAWVDVTGNTVQVDPGTHAYYRFVNLPVPAITLPLTGGVGTDLFLILGGLAILAALGAGLWYGYRRRATRVGGV